MSDLREALEAAVTEQETQDAPETTVDTAPAETQEAAGAPEVGDVQDEAGEGQQQAAPEEDGNKAVPETKDKADSAPAQEQARQHRIDRPPQSWKKEAKGEWANIPLHVRQEVYRREQEVARTLQEAAPARQFHQEFQQTVAPYMARLQSAGVEPIQAVKFLMDADFQLATANPVGKAQLMAKLINDYGVDISALDEALAGTYQQQPQQPQQTDIEQRILRQVQQQFAPVLTFAQQQQQLMAQQQQQLQEKATQTIEQMALDPQFPYFDEVREEMADLIELSAKRGIYLTPEQAYHKAVQLNPETFGEIQKQSQMSQAQTTHQQAQRARAAASSVSGAPASGGGGEFVGDGSLRGAIEAAFGNARV